MKHVVIIFTVASCLVICGCGRNHELHIPAIDRLQTESPIVNGKIKISECQLNGADVSESIPFRVRPGESIKLTGRFSPAEWKPAHLLCVWHYEKGDPRAFETVESEQGGGLQLPIPIRLLIHEDDDTGTRLGVIGGGFVDARRLVAGKTDFEFLARCEAPKRTGKYVLDIQVEDPTVNYRKRDEPRTKVDGFPVWRCELWVE